MAIEDEVTDGDGFSLNASLPINDKLLNMTTAMDIANGTLAGEYDYPKDWFGVVIFVVLAIMVVCLCWTWCRSRSPQLGLAVVLANMVLTVPLSNIFAIPGQENWGDHLVWQIVDWYQLVCLAVAIYLTFVVVSQATSPPNPNLITRTSGLDGQEYPHEYIGCGQCGVVLSKSWFCSCKTCTAQKVGGCNAFELCQKCVLSHDRSHEILLWVDDSCRGAVDWEATINAHQTHEIEPLMAGQSG